MTDTLTDMARAVGVLADCRHRPPIDHISPTAAAGRDEDDDEGGLEIDEPVITWTRIGAAAALIIWFWLMFVMAWAIAGGAE